MDLPFAEVPGGYEFERPTPTFLANSWQSILIIKNVMWPNHSNRGVQYVSIRYTERVAGAGGVTSVGSRGDSYDCDDPIDRQVDLRGILKRGRDRGNWEQPVDIACNESLEAADDLPLCETLCGPSFRRKRSWVRAIAYGR